MGRISSKSPSNTVDSAAITDGSITSADLNPTLSINTTQIANLAVTTAKIALQNVETAQIKDLAVTTAKIDDSAVTNVKIADSTITPAKFNLSSFNQTTVSNVTGSYSVGVNIINQAFTLNNQTRFLIDISGFTNAFTASGSGFDVKVNGGLVARYYPSSLTGGGQFHFVYYAPAPVGTTPTIVVTPCALGGAINVERFAITVKDCL